MKVLWKLLNRINIDSDIKRFIFIFLMIVFWGIVGGILWLGVGRLILSDFWWLFSFIGYPAVFIGYFTSVIYLNGHDFT